MDVKDLLEWFVLASVVIVGSRVAYSHYVEGKTPSSAALQALKEYNGALEALVGGIGSVALELGAGTLDAIEHRRKVS